MHFCQGISKCPLPGSVHYWDVAIIRGFSLYISKPKTAFLGGRDEKRNPLGYTVKLFTGRRIHDIHVYKSQPSSGSRRNRRFVYALKIAQTTEFKTSRNYGHALFACATNVKKVRAVRWINNVVQTCAKEIKLALQYRTSRIVLYSISRNFLKHNKDITIEFITMLSIFG